MAPYRNYDYGLRGSRETMAPRMYGAYRPRGYDYGYDERSWARPNRVTARYNMDYVRGYASREERYGQNFHFYGGDRMDRMGDQRWYRMPRMTNGGTRSWRGSPYPTGYDYPDFGPNYGGRWPDEL